MPAVAADPWFRAKAGKAMSSAPKVRPKAAAVATTVRMPAPASAGRRPGFFGCGPRARAPGDAANARAPTRLSAAAAATAAVGDHSAMSPPASSGPAMNVVSCIIVMSA